MDAMTVPAPCSPRAEVTSLVPLRPLPMFCGDDFTPTVRPAAPETTTMSKTDIETARSLMVQCAEARIAQREAAANAALAHARRETAFARVAGAMSAKMPRPVVIVAEAAEAAAKAEHDVWTKAEWDCEDIAVDCARMALAALRGGDVRAADDEWSDVQEPDLTIDAYVTRVLAAMSADRAA